MLRQEPVDWTCIAGYKYFFVSSRGKFWLCSQVRTERHILEITREDLLSYNRKKSCQAGCGVYCTAEASLAVSHPLKYAAREVAGMLTSRASRMRRGGATRIRDLATALTTAGAERALVNSIRLVFLRANRAEETIDEMVVLQSHTQLAGEAALDHRVLDDPEDEHLGDPAAAILGLDPERNQSRGPDSTLVVKQFGEANRDSEGR